MTTPLLEIRDLAIRFELPGRPDVQAVNGLDLSLHRHQTLAVVGESGCGKTVTALSVLGLVVCPPGRIERGSIALEGRDLLTLPPSELRRIRGRDIGMIFQEPMNSLNPVHRVGDQIIESIRLHQSVSRRRARALAIEAFAAVGISEPERRLRAYPHEFSGGMCQRAMIAMALAGEPRVLIADEPTTALDVTVQAQILDLLRRIQRERGMSIMLITHDLGVVAHVADTVCVMFDGRVVEYASVFDLFEQPLHPYSRGLFSSIPRIERRRHRLRTVAEFVGSPKSFQELPSHEFGVVPWWPAMDPPDDLVDAEDPVRLVEVEPNHWVACWNTSYVAAHPVRPPNLDFRRNDVSDSVANNSA